MAGPNLTPQTFEAGLQRTLFPNPGSGAAPYYQAHVGFTDDHVFNDDAALVYWNPTAVSLEDGLRGAFCYVNPGTRYSLGNWPSAPLTLFNTSAPCY